MLEKVMFGSDNDNLDCIIYLIDFFKIFAIFNLLEVPMPTKEYNCKGVWKKSICPIASLLVEFRVSM